MDAAGEFAESDPAAEAQQRRQRRARMGEPGWFPDHGEEWRADFRRTTPEERVLEGIELSRFATRVAVAGRTA